ncbi:hypothetical protein [Pseudomonas syringae]|nr:hypothetical protein [Pseudomonas syringae]
MKPEFLLRLVQKLKWLAGCVLLLIALLWLADRLWPLPLPKDDLVVVN